MKDAVVLNNDTVILNDEPLAFTQRVLSCVKEYIF